MMTDRVARRRARYETLAAAVGDSRGQRFARRLDGRPPVAFGDIAKMPDWLMLPPAHQDQVAQLAGLLRHRPAIDRELSGPRLTMLANHVGEALLDAACAVDIPESDDNAPLPPPERVVSDGWALLHASLPQPFATLYPGASGEPSARAMADQACAIATVEPA